MCALLRELVVPVADLHRLAVKCDQCKTVTTLDFTTRIQTREGLAVPGLTECPVCHHSFNAGLKDRIQTLGTILEWMRDLGPETVSFRVPPPAE
jgi:hypothetical protein